MVIEVNLSRKYGITNNTNSLELYQQRWFLSYSFIGIKSNVGYFERFGWAISLGNCLKCSAHCCFGGVMSRDNVSSCYVSANVVHKALGLSWLNSLRTYLSRVLSCLIARFICAFIRHDVINMDDLRCVISTASFPVVTVTERPVIHYLSSSCQAVH